ncbi:hypothetical protein EV702DRAFT_1182714 [Suillus placidus]|uniref:Uncharacterized protein n=1 Tax=Suillus placidus TaxID=48579 RepID=A0A9P6ZFL6_9AGAM|nr:hypothetical protein EV702DRAFT_1182714 [Suillus placidus]
MMTAHISLPVSRGGLGKYLRARGRGRGGRSAEFHQRLAKELQKKYSWRRLRSNADRYVELEPELNFDGEEIREPEVDLSSFLARQRLSDVSETTVVAVPRKGRVQAIEWDAELEEMSREKGAADASRDLKARFRAKSEKLKAKPLFSRDRKQGRMITSNYSEAPTLPTDAPKAPKVEMETFLDELLG